MRVARKKCGRVEVHPVASKGGRFLGAGERRNPSLKLGSGRKGRRGRSGTLDLRVEEKESGVQ